MAVSWFSVLLLALTSSGINCCEVSFDPPGKNSYLYAKLEDALLGNRTALYALRNAFFSPQTKPRNFILLYFCLNITNVNCSHPGTINDHSFERCWDFQWSSLAIMNWITADELLAFDNGIMRTVGQDISLGGRHTVKVTLQIEQLSCIPTNTEVLSTVISFLGWVRLLVLNNTCPMTIAPWFLSLAVRKVWPTVRGYLQINVCH